MNQDHVRPPRPHSQTPSRQALDRRRFLRLSAAALAAAPAAGGALRAAWLDDAVRPGFQQIDSLADFERALASRGNKIRLKPGVYRIDHAQADNKTLFHVTGSNNHFDLRGVTLQLDTRVLAAMRGKVHQLAGYRITGSNLIFEGGVFEDLGQEPPYESLSDFDVGGNDITFRDCTFTVRGSAPYGYGDLFGKGAGALVRLQKHAAMSVRGNNTQILGCRFFMHTFGHAIHMHGAQNTLVQDVSIEGTLRNSDEILAETTGHAARLQYKNHYGRPIRPNTMICLNEDAIRAYLDGGRDKPHPRTADITVINCTVKRMRGGVTLALASGKIDVRGCTVTECGYPGHAYSLPTGARVRDCRGDAAYAPLLHMGYSHQHDADIEMTLLAAQRYVGNNLVALLNGSRHKVTIAPPRDAPSAARAKPSSDPASALQIVCGQTYRGDQADVGKTSAREIELVNHTRAAVLLSALSSGCKVRSAGPVQNEGKDNTVVQV